ncbi:Adenylate kinase 2 [Vanrija albida]|uniref:GTP:AMP phosphotransferase, mitochondrial n=1 Tax=Vanrija albida TaxID=181172 RepID=A0ABR3Q539_9TREE
MAALRRAPRLSSAYPALRLAPRAAALSTSAIRRDEKLVETVMATARRNVEDGKRAPTAHDGEKGVRLLMFGKPGSGKGTLSAKLVEAYDVAFISTGDLLRQEIAAKSEVGKKAEEIVRTGGLVSDELMLEMVIAELEHHHGQSWIIDGFPRTLKQGQLLNEVLQKQRRPFNMVVNLNVPDAVIMQRIAARWVHLPSGRVYNDTYSAPKVAGKDDVTGEPLSKRPDDTPEVFSKRLQSYYKQTAPLLEFFAHEYPDVLHSLTGSSSDQLWPMLRALIDEAGLEPRFEHVRKQADDLADTANVPLEDGAVAHVGNDTASR